MCALGDFLVLFAPVLRQIARYLPHHRSENASKTHPKSSHDKFKTASKSGEHYLLFIDYQPVTKFCHFIIYNSKFYWIDSGRFICKKSWQSVNRFKDMEGTSGWKLHWHQWAARKAKHLHQPWFSRQWFDGVGSDGRHWHLKCEHKAAQYTTSLCEVIKVKV